MLCLVHRYKSQYGVTLAMKLHQTEITNELEFQVKSIYYILPYIF